MNASTKVEQRLAILFTFIAIAGTAGTAAAAHKRCVPLNARLNASLVMCPMEFPSAIGMCTSGRTEHGLLSGTTRFRATAAAPSAGIVATIEPGTTLSYTGDLEITTVFGTLKFRDVGVTDGASAIFTEMGRFVEGSGWFKNAEGHIFVSGTSGADGSFDGALTGTICWP